MTRAVGQRLGATLAVVVLVLLAAGCGLGTAASGRGAAEAGPMATGPSAAGATGGTVSAPMTSVGDDPGRAGPRAAHGERASPRERLARLRGRTERSVPDVARIAQVRRAMVRWFACTRLLGVGQIGDRHHRWGYVYDEMDGTGTDFRTALAVHTDRRSLPPWRLIRFLRAPGCRSMPTNPNGTGAEARAGETAAARPSPARQGRVPVRVAARRLLARLGRLDDSLAASQRSLRRYDHWESCLVWLPVTEAGDRRQGLGFAYQVPGEVRRAPAIDVDHGNWDDPDYQLLAFRGAARPFRGLRCGPGPGEDPDRGARAAAGASDGSRAVSARVRRPSLDDLLGEVAEGVVELEDEVEDARKDAIEFVHFDQCMYTVGITSFGGPAQHVGYRFVDERGRTSLRRALAFDLTGFRAPQFDVMAFPGEEPPQIECNEDAGGQETDE